MKHLYTPFLFFLLFISISQAQVTITRDDMPNVGDTIRKSITYVLGGVDYASTGENYLWDFSSFVAVVQQVDTFVSVSSTPVIYQAVFNNQFIFPDYKATIARKMNEFNLIPNFTITDSYDFLKESGEDYRDVGYGVAISGVQIPIRYNDIDIMYRFPIQYGNVDSCESLIQIDVPSLGYLESSKHRKNIADGWGTVITPYGEFEALRVKTMIMEYDSLYSDSLGVGYGVNRNITEYKWFGNGYGLPLMLISEEGFVTSATYIDSIRNTLLDVPQGIVQNYTLKVYPNPCTDFLSVSYELTEKAEVRISIYSIYGNELKNFVNTVQDHGLYTRIIYPREQGIKPGIYLLRLQVDNVPSIKRIIIQ